MISEWDAGKAQLNVRKHGVHFADAVTALEDDRAFTMRDPSPMMKSAGSHLLWMHLGGCLL
jgi:uncharacterized DUF497 family protein